MRYYDYDRICRRIEETPWKGRNQQIWLDMAVSMNFYCMRCFVND